MGPLATNFFDQIHVLHEKELPDFNFFFIGTPGEVDFDFQNDIFNS